MDALTFTTAWSLEIGILTHFTATCVPFLRVALYISEKPPKATGSDEQDLAIFNSVV